MSYEPSVVRDLTLPHTPLNPMARVPLGHVRLRNGSSTPSRSGTCPSCETKEPSMPQVRPGQVLPLPSPPVRRGRWRKPPPSQDFARCWWPLSNPCRKLARSREGHVVVIFYMSDSALHQTSSASDAGEPITIDLSPLIILICQLPLTFVCSGDLCTRSSSD